LTKLVVFQVDHFLLLATGVKTDILNIG